MTWGFKRTCIQVSPSQRWDTGKIAPISARSTPYGQDDLACKLQTKKAHAF